MEMAVPVRSFHSDSATAAPYMSAPSSPAHFSIDPFDLCCNYATAPTSPVAAGVAAAADDNFVFDLSLQEKSTPLKALSSADELFEQGLIRPLNPPPRLSSSLAGHQSGATVDRGGAISPPSSFPIPRPHGRKGSESNSLVRADKGAHFQTPICTLPYPTEIISCSCRGWGSSGGGGRSRKWCFKGFLPFRSSLEGRATQERSKDPLQRFTTLPSPLSSSFIRSSELTKESAGGDDSWSSNFRSVESDGPTRLGIPQHAASPHALHYEVKRAAAEGTRKKTALPYRQNFFSCVRFTPASHSLTKRAFGDHFSDRGRP